MTRQDFFNELASNVGGFTRLAEILEVNRKTLYMYRVGKADPSPAILVKINALVGDWNITMKGLFE